MLKVSGEDTKSTRNRQLLCGFLLLLCAIWCFRGFLLKIFAFRLQNKGHLIFEDKWPAMEPVVLKLLLQEHVDNG